jgi:hypothetical protein
MPLATRTHNNVTRAFIGRSANGFDMRFGANTRPHSRGAMRPRFCDFPPRIEGGTTLKRGRGECRVPDAPAAARVEVVSTRVSHHGRTGITRHSRTRWCYGFLRALPGDRACLPPSPRRRDSTRLDASVGASEPHDFAVRLRAIRQRHIRVHRIPCPTSVTMADAPPMGHGMAAIRW